MRSTEAFNVEIGAALLRFNEEAVLYCRRISDADAHEYAMDYARMLRSRAHWIECTASTLQPIVLLPNYLSRFVFLANVGKQQAGDFICFCFEEVVMHPTLTVGWAFVFSGIV